MAGGTVRTNIETYQGIYTFKRFQTLMEVPQKDNSASSQDDQSSYSGPLHNSTNRATKSTVNVNIKSKEATKSNPLPEICVQLLECQPCFTSKTHNDDIKFDLKGNKNKTGFSDQRS